MSLISKQKINSNLTGNEQFFNSSNIKVFPCAYRGYWEEFTEHQKTDNFTRDGSSTSFELSFLPVKINSITGVEASSVYSIEGKTINFEVAPTASDTKIQVIYKYLSTELKSQGFDPEAQATTEYNLTNLYGKLSSNKESYIISFTNIGSNLYLLKCVIGGYYFEINNVTINDIKGKYLGVKSREFALENRTQDTDRKSKVLESIIGDDYYLDVNADDEYAFTGLAVDSSNINYNYTLKVIKDDGTVNWQEKTILNVLDTGSGKYSLQSLNEDSENNCIASGDYSIAVGNKTEAKNNNAVAFGNNTKTNMNEQVVLGKFNTETDNAYLVIGGGTSNSDRKNVVEVRTNGTINTKGDLIANGSGRTNTLTLGNAATNNSGAIDIYGSSTTKVFTVDNAGNTNISGNLNAYSNFNVSDKFSVQGTTGYTELNGALTVDGNVNVNGDITCNKNGANNRLTLGTSTANSSGTIRIYGSGLNTNVELTVNNSGNLAINSGVDVNGKITSSDTAATDGNSTLITKGYLENYVTQSIAGKADSTSVNSSVTDLAGQISKAASDAADNLSEEIRKAKESINQLISDAKDELKKYTDDAKDAAEKKIDDEFAAKVAQAAGGTSSGKYIIGVSQTNGQITAEEGSFSTSIRSTDTTNAPTAKAVYECVNQAKTEVNTNISNLWVGALVKETSNATSYSYLKDLILDAVYPVGSIYMSTSSTTCPINRGTWEVMSSGKFLMAAGDNYDLGAEGGYKDAATISHDHSITINNATPKDLTCKDSLQASYIDVRRINGETDANIIMGYGGSIAGDKVTYSNKPATVTGWDDKIYDHQRINFNLVHNHTISGGKHAHTGTIGTTGEDGINRNLPPYIAVYMWQRTK